MINWEKLPYKHENYKATYKSIFNPNGNKITFPQLIAEAIIWRKSKVLKDYPKIQYGPGWHHANPKEVRGLVQQAYTILNYFENISTEPLVEVAIKNVLKTNKVIAIGGFRKTRVSEEGKCTVTQSEKDFVISITKELERLKAQRDIFKNIPEVKVKTENITFKRTNSVNKLLELENKVKNAQRDGIS